MKQSLIGVQHSSGQMIPVNILAGSHILVQGIFQSTTAASQVISFHELPYLISPCFQSVLTDQEPNYEVLQLLSPWIISPFPSVHPVYKVKFGIRVQG